MAVLGVFCFPGTGHINPLTALARRLGQRGHRVIVFGIADTEARVRAAGIEFCQVGAEDYPLGTLAGLDRKLSTLKGLNSFRFTVERVKNHAHMVLRDAPTAVKAAGVEALLVDEADMAGSVAESLGLPFVSIACFPPLLQDNTIPPFLFGWRYDAGWLGRLRNRIGSKLLKRVAWPVYKEMNVQRLRWGLAPLRQTVEGLSRLAQIAQLPEALEFPVANKPEWLHYTGPFVDRQVREPVAFPWERLDGRPLVYGSMGTLQNGSEKMFRTIAEACTGLDVQLVLSMGGGGTERARRTAGETDCGAVCSAAGAGEARSSGSNARGAEYYAGVIGRRRAAGGDSNGERSARGRCADCIPGCRDRVAVAATECGAAAAGDRRSAAGSEISRGGAEAASGDSGGGWAGAGGGPDRRRSGAGG